MTNVQLIVEHTTKYNFLFLQHWYPEQLDEGNEIEIIIDELGSTTTLGYPEP